MPPRHAYWTILIDNTPTAFRARDEEELLPTLNQLRRKNNDVVMKWFARGRLWDTPEQAQWAGRNLKGSEEKRGKDWRPGGEHKDPRARFDKKSFRPGAQPKAGDKPALRRPPRAGDKPAFRRPPKAGYNPSPGAGIAHRPDAQVSPKRQKGGEPIEPKPEPKWPTKWPPRTGDN